MKKLNVLVVGLLLPLLAAAQTVKSPNGNVSVTFSLTGGVRLLPFATIITKWR